MNCKRTPSPLNFSRHAPVCAKRTASEDATSERTEVRARRSSAEALAKAGSTSLPSAQLPTKNGAPNYFVSTTWQKSAQLIDNASFQIPVRSCLYALFSRKSLAFCFLQTGCRGVGTSS